ncbi:MAG: hypothetical protein Q9161_007537 [Pseudevernia consocians]
MKPTRHHAQTHPRGRRYRPILQATSSRTSLLAPEPPAAINPYPQRRRGNGSKSGTGVLADRTQGQLPKRRRRKRKSRAPGNTGSNTAATREANTMSNAAERDREISDSRASKVRSTEGHLEWFDEEEDQWIWTEDMGTDYTSFSPLTQGWTNDLMSVIDFKGRHIFSMEARPADLMGKPVYGNLLYNGLVMLDQENDPVRDIPGIPHTLDASAPGWLLEGLRRCTSMEVPDLKARSAHTKNMAEGPKKLKSRTYLTNRMHRWMKRNQIKGWDERPNARKSKRSPAAIHESQGSEAARSGYLPPAGLQLGLDDDNSNLLTHDTYLSPEPSYDRDYIHTTAQSEAGPYTLGGPGSPLSSWQPNVLAEYGGYGDTNHSLFPRFYDPNPGLQRVAVYNDGFCESEDYNEYDLWRSSGYESNEFGSSGLDKEYPDWNPNDPIALPYYIHPQSQNSPYYLGSQDTFARPNQKQRQSYGDQEEHHGVWTNTSLNADTQDSLFLGGDFRHIQPETATEIVFPL